MNDEATGEPSDSSLIRLTAGGADTRHRVTEKAYAEIRRYHRVFAGYDDERFRTFVLDELEMLAPTAYALDILRGRFLKTDYGFDVHCHRKGELLYVPNDAGGITIMTREESR